MKARLKPIDADDRRANFGCGFLAGALAGATGLLTAADWPFIVLAGLVVGVLAARYGGRFWTSMAQWLLP
jgi:hypothetical protein